MGEPKHRLKINLSDLAEGFEHHDMEMIYYLDLETSEVLMTTDEGRRLMERIRETCRNEETKQIDWPKAIAEYDIHDWQQEELETLDRIEAGLGNRYIEIPQEESRVGYNDMEDFIATVTNPYLQARLEKAINDRSPFRHFKDALLSYPKERERWFAFQNERREGRIREWLEEEEIELIEEDED